ncbi:MAG: adenylate/guanylate cyclase domain-containing protein [Synechococcaceae cyanobacterium]
MAVCGAPLSQGREGDARAALAAARGIRARIASLNEVLTREGAPRVRLRLGLHSGWVLAGSLGSRDRWEYGVIGDAVNCAARLVALPGSPMAEGCRILISALSRDLAGAGANGSGSGGLESGGEGGAESGGEGGDSGRCWGAVSLHGRQQREEIWEV